MSGSRGEARTPDQDVNSVLLYRLSYSGMVEDNGIEPMTPRCKRGVFPTILIPLIPYKDTLDFSAFVIEWLFYAPWFQRRLPTPA